jgi:hypothetical protein
VVRLHLVGIDLVRLHLVRLHLVGIDLVRLHVVVGGLEVAPPALPGAG